MKDVFEVKKELVFRALGVVAIMASVLLVTPRAADAQCAGAMALTANKTAVVFDGGGATTLLRAHIGTTCSAGVPRGSVTACVRNVQTSKATLDALWADATARAAAVSGGCDFNCQLGNCFVGNDGLPVELLGFGVE